MIDQVTATATPLTKTGTGRQAIQQIVKHSDALMDQMRELHFAPEKKKVLRRRFTMKQAAQMVGRSDDTIRRAEAAGDLPKPELSKAGRRTGYTLAEVNAMRDYFNANPWRADDEEPIRLAFQNFKGGVGKTTLCVHFAQDLAEKGYRVLLIDCDSQASTTATFGIRPDRDVDEGDTLLPFFDGHRTDLGYAIRTTYWDRLDVIPANLSLYAAEYQLAGSAGATGGSWIDLLLAGIETIQDNYDVIIMDPPPALGMISLSVVRSLNALIVPVPPQMYDYHSSVTFFRMMDEVLESVEEAIGGPIDFKVFNLLVSNYDKRNSAQEFMVRLMSDHYARYMLQGVIQSSAEIDNASSELDTVFELTGPSSNKKTYDRCISSLKGAFKEIELSIRRTWPSHAARLEADGHLVI